MPNIVAIVQCLFALKPSKMEFVFFLFFPLLIFSYIFQLSRNEQNKIQIVMDFVIFDHISLDFLCEIWPKVVLFGRVTVIWGFFLSSHHLHMAKRIEKNTQPKYSNWSLRSFESLISVSYVLRSPDDGRWKRRKMWKT